MAVETKKLAINCGIPVSETMIPIAKPLFTDDCIKDVVKVLKSGNIRQGSRVKEFEEKFREKIGCRYAYAVSSGTAALHIAYLSILKPGDEVIVPALTFIATASTVIFAGGKPVFSDIDEETFTIDPEDVLEKISDKTKAIAPVHLFGHPADMRTLTEIAEDNDLYLVNDAAQALCSRINGQDVGSFNDMNCYSFYATKNITTGEGGMVTTNDKDLYDKGRLIRSHGQESKYYHTILGLNYRMTEIEAVIGLCQLNKLDDFIEKRRKNAYILTKGLEKIKEIRPPVVKKEFYHSFNQYSVLMNLEEFKCNRDEFVKSLKAENIGCSVHYPLPLTHQPVLKRYSKGSKCPVAEDVSQKIFSLPVHPYLNKTHLGKIVVAVEKVVSHYLK